MIFLDWLRFDDEVFLLRFWLLPMGWETIWREILTASAGSPSQCRWMISRSCGRSWSVSPSSCLQVRVSKFAAHFEQLPLHDWILS